MSWENCKYVQDKYYKLWCVLESVGDKGEAFDKLMDKYSSPSRFYHGVDHITYCLKEFEKVAKMTVNVSALILGILYHDVEDTELKSAEFMKGEAEKYGWSKDIVEEAYSLILETAHKSYDSSLGIDSQLITDIDLSSLGGSWAFFLSNWQKVRDEWKHIPMDTFIEKRLEILESFLNRPGGIFRTSYFRNLYEAQAGENIRRARRFFGAG